MEKCSRCNLEPCQCPEELQEGVVPPTDPGTDTPYTDPD